MNARLTTRQVFLLLLTLGAIIYVPYLGASYYGKIGTDYFKYPIVDPIVKEIPFHRGVFIANAVIAGIILLLYLVPRLFGFKKNTTPVPILPKSRSFPTWFWIGIVLFAAPLTLLIMRVHEPTWIVNFALVPIFWGFTLILDGFVYYVNEGRSLASKGPTELMALGVVSISGWLFFDYLNFFIGGNWYYPNARQVGIENYEFLIYATIGSSGFFPMAFEWYYLLRKVKVFNYKYRLGPKIRVPEWLHYALIGISLVGLFVTPNHPDNFFFIIWLGPLIILASALSLMKIWNPFTPLRTGDWSVLLTFALTYLVQGFLLEWGNYVTANHTGGEMETTNCAYWVYALPYLHKYLIFEMPILGYMGYLFFSIHIFIWWIVMTRLMGVSTEFFDHDSKME